MSKRHCEARTFRVLAVLLTMLSLAPGRADAQPSDEQIGNSEFFILFPQLRSLAAPEVLTAGLRASYSTLSGGGGVGGAGVLQYDVVAIGATTVVASQHSYGDIGAGVIPLGQTVARGVPGLGPFWINPTVLATAEAVASDSLVVSRYDKEVAGAVRAVVRFQTNTSDGGRVVHEFSAASGLLVFSSIGTTESGSQVTLVSARQLALPWTPDAAPNWARPGTTLEYAGTKSTAIPGSGVSEQTVSATVAVSQATRSWTAFLQSQTVGGVDGGTGETVTGIAQLHGGIWLPRSALAAQLPTAPTRIDADAVTGAETFLVSDATSITIQQELSGAIVSWTYSRPLGVLEQQRIAQQGPVADEETMLNRVGGSDLVALDEEPQLPEEPPRDDGSDANNGSENNAAANNADPDGPPGEQDDPVVVRTDEDGGCSSTGQNGSAGRLLLLPLLALARRRT